MSGIAGDKTVRSDKDNSKIRQKTWDGKQLQAYVEAQARIMEAFGQQAAKAIGTYATSKLNDLDSQIKKERDPAKKAELQGEAKNWAEGGAYRTALHATAGASLSALSMSDCKTDRQDGCARCCETGIGTGVRCDAGGSGGRHDLPPKN